ncbi:glycoside hydrolase family 19 protein [Enterobacter cloacae]
MKICFPARKANGEQYATLDDMMQPLCQEPHGSWLAGTNNMWHGGIHITSKSAPGSVLTNETADTAEPLQFMAGGEVVAWRINQDYLTGKYINNPLQYSSTFVLVKSTCTPDPEKKDNSLDFYSLYIGLAPLSAFPEHKLYQVTEKGDGLSQREYTGKEKDGDNAPVVKDKLKTGDCVLVLRDITFDLKGQAQTFGLARALNSKSEMTGGAFWVSLDPQYMTPAGKQRAHLPAWMQQAVTQGTFDAVVKPATKLEVAAGDAVGYLAKDIAPDSMGGVEKSAFVHVEVLSTDARMSDFLSNKAQVKTGPKYVHIHPESSVYARSGDTFTKTEGKVKKDIHKIMPQDKCHPFTDKDGKRWFDIGDGAWLNEADVDADINQYDLTKLGFGTFEEPSTSDMTKSLSEGWIKDGFTKIAEWVRPERGIQEKQVSDYYKALLRKMDSDNSGDLSGEELRHAVHFPEMDVRDIAARMVVKHDSEWFGGSSHHRWKTFLKQMDPLCVSYVKQWFDDMEWMSKVDEFSSGKPVWHMHPVVFLDAIKTVESGFITLEMVLAANLGKNETQCKEILPYLNKYADAYGMKDKKEIAHFLSQIGHESGFVITEENLNYSGKGMRRIFGCKNGPKNYNKANDDCDLGRLRNKLWTQESTYAHHPENLANYVYAGRMGNDDEASGDGYKYRGRGMIQLTGKDGYRYFTNMHNKKNPSDSQDFVASPDLVISNVEYGVESAFSFWVSKGLNVSAKNLNVYDVTFKVNGGHNGYDDRRIRFNKVAELLNINKD